MHNGGYDRRRIPMLGRSFIDRLGPLGLDPELITQVTIEAARDDFVVLEVEAVVPSDSGQDLVDQVTRYALFELVDDASDDQEDEQ